MYWAAHSEAILDSVLMRTYTTLTPRIVTSQITRSDSWPFALRGFKAIFAIEDEGDFNPHYHQPLDSSIYLDFTYAKEIVQSAVALTLTIDATVTSVGEQSSDVPLTTSLTQNYPNPFNPETRIGFTLASRQYVRITVFDVLGREVAILLDGVAEAGSHTVRWDAKASPAGTYFCRMTSEGTMQVRRMSLIQ
jgi:hypothetical protein